MVHGQFNIIKPKWGAEIDIQHGRTFQRALPGGAVYEIKWRELFQSVYPIHHSTANILSQSDMLFKGLISSLP